jgi:hypothetical protein
MAMLSSDPKLSRSLWPLFSRQNLRQMRHANPGLLAVQRPIDMHQAAVIASRASLRACI